MLNINRMTEGPPGIKCLFKQYNDFLFPVSNTLDLQFIHKFRGQTFQ